MKMIEPRQSPMLRRNPVEFPEYFQLERQKILLGSPLEE
jgi:hypothetical protein